MKYMMRGRMQFFLCACLLYSGAAPLKTTPLRRSSACRISHNSKY